MVGLLTCEHFFFFANGFAKARDRRHFSGAVSSGTFLAEGVLEYIEGGSMNGHRP